MKTLLIAEYRDGKLLGSYQELLGFSSQLGAESIMFAVGKKEDLPDYPGTLYLADSDTYGEFNPAVHKVLLLQVIKLEEPDIIVFSHSSYGWDLAPRIAFTIEAAQVSEIIELKDNLPVVPVCNAKIRRTIEPKSEKYVATLQAGAFTPTDNGGGSPNIIDISTTVETETQFHGYEAAEQGGVDLTKSEVIISAGRGIGKSENIQIIADLAEKLGGQYGASRPVVDAEWAEHNRQVGTTGQTVSPKLYMACGISGAIQHLAGMKKSEFIVAVNTDKDAPIGEIADVLVVSDLKQFVPALIERL